MIPWLILAGIGLCGGVAFYEKTKTPPPDLKGKVTPEREVILQTALSTVDDPLKLQTLATAFAQQGLPDQATALLQKANQGNGTITPVNANVPILGTVGGLSLQQMQQRAQELGGKLAILPPGSAEWIAVQTEMATLVQEIQTTFAAAAASTAMQASFPTSTPPVATFQPPNPVIPISSPVNLSIAQIQRILNGFGVGMSAGLQLDGLPGPSTNAAIKKFQDARNIVEAAKSLSAKGNIASVGPLTTAALLQAASDR